MHQIPTPDAKRELEIIILFMLQLYATCGNKETRRYIKHRYRDAAKKYNKLVGHDLYCLNITLQKKLAQWW